MNDPRILLLDLCEGKMANWVIICDSQKRNKPLFVIEEEDWKELIKDYNDYKEME